MARRLSLAERECSCNGSDCGYCGRANAAGHTLTDEERRRYRARTIGEELAAADRKTA